MKSTITKQYIVLIIITSLFLISCEYEAQLTYRVLNNTDKNIKLISTNNHRSLNKTDTFNIKAKEIINIAVNEQGLNGIDKYKETEQYLRDFTQMDSFIEDTLKNKNNFLESNRWTYQQTSRHWADYILVISNSDF